MTFSSPRLPVLSLAILLMAAALPATGEGAVTAPTAPADADKGFESLWRACGTRCAAFEDDFLVVPDYSPQCESSRGLTRGEVESRLTLVLDKDNDREITAGPEEKRALDALPKLAPGQYGWIHSVEIVGILGPKDVLVKNIWLADADTAKAQKEYAANKKKILEEQEQQEERAIAKKEAADKSVIAAIRAQPGNKHRETVEKSSFKQNVRKSENELKQARANLKKNLAMVDDVAEAVFKARTQAVAEQGRGEFAATCRLSGFPTAGLKIGDRWNGPAAAPGMRVAVAWADAKDNTLVLVPADMLGTAALKKELFLDLLKKRGLTAADFITRMKEAEKRGHRDPAEVVTQGLMRGVAAAPATVSAQAGGQDGAPPQRGKQAKPPARIEQPAAPVEPGAPAATPEPVAPPAPAAPPGLEKPIFDNN